MSEMMNIRFGPDMAMTSIEVMTPDLETIYQNALSAGDEVDVEVPSADAFVRLRLPSGQAVTLRRREDLTYLVTRSLLRREPKKERSIRSTIDDIKFYNRFRSMEVSDRSNFRSSNTFYEPSNNLLREVVLPGGFEVRWTPPVIGSPTDDGAEIAYAPYFDYQPYELRIDGPLTYVIKIPGSVGSAYVRTDLVGEAQHLVSVRIATNSSEADTVGSYLAHSDYSSAQTMAEWATQAEHMLQMKMSNPYAATVAAYLLLRLERFDLMHDWPKNLANNFEELPDGNIIWAAQCALDRRDRAAALEYIDLSFEKGLPVFTEGLAWLTRVLRLLGADGESYLKRLRGNTAGIIWNSPFTTLAEGYERDTSNVSLDIAYATKI